MIKVSKILISILEQEYRGVHKAPEKQEGASLDNLSNIFPEDLYSSKGFTYYADDMSSSYDRQSYNIILKYRNKPNEKVKIYRAIPSNLPKDEQKINKGDWVTVSKAYAIHHGKYIYDKDYIIVSYIVYANQLYSEGSINEWSYNP